MRKLKLLMAACALMVGAGTSWGQNWTSGSVVAAGDYYLYNIGGDVFYNVGSSWDTHSIADGQGRVLTVELAEGGYKLKTNVSGGKGPYAWTAWANDDNGDGTNYWVFTPVSLAGYTNAYTLQMNTDNQYLYLADGTGKWGNEVLNAADINNDIKNNFYWLLIPKATREDYSGATESSPVDMTYLVKNPDHEQFHTPKWTGDYDYQNNGAAGTRANFFERWTGTWNTTAGSGDGGTLNDAEISQTLSDLPAGKYRLDMNTFARRQWDESLIDISGVTMYAGEESTVIKNEVKVHSVNFTTTGGDVTIGIKIKGTDANWVVADNTRLYYFGADLTLLKVLYNDALTEAQGFTEESMFASDWSALQTAITDNTLNLSDVTKAQLETATDNLKAANTAATAAVTYKTAVSLIDGGKNVDLTSLIVNPSFENGVEGWTNNGMTTQGNSSFGKTGSTYAECWQPNGTKSLTQTIGSLPAGVYMLSLRAKTRGVTSAKIFANADEFALIIEDKEHDYNVAFEIADKASVNIGFEGVGTGAGSSWLALDNFTLKYIGTVNDLTYTLATGKMGTDKATAQTDAETTFLAGKTIANYNALATAIIAAETSKANYDALKAAIDKAEAVKSANNFVTADATTAFENEISTATSAWTDVTYTDAEATTEIKTLGTAVSGWHANATGAAGTFMASTWGKTNANWWDAPYINTWSTEGDSDGSGFSVPFFEWYEDATHNLPLNETKTATLSGLANGCYEVELWARVQRRTDADFGNNSEITMSVNGGDAVSIMNSASTIGSGNTQMRIGRYKARGMVTDGTLTLSIKTGSAGSNVHWLSWRDVKYNKIADETVTITSAGYATYCSTNALDFSGTGIKVYRATAAAGKVTFHEITSGKVAGSNGLLLKGAEGTYEVPVITDGENEANMLTGVLTATDIDAGNFVLLNGAKGVGFYKTTKTFTVGAHTAYIAASSVPSEGRLFIGFDDEEEVTGIRELNSSANKGAIYNMNGVRVEKAKKGLYIQNGKKIVVK